MPYYVYADNGSYPAIAPLQGLAVSSIRALIWQGLARLPPLLALCPLVGGKRPSLAQITIIEYIYYSIYENIKDLRAGVALQCAFRFICGHRAGSKSISLYKNRAPEPHKAPEL